MHRYLTGSHQYRNCSTCMNVPVGPGILLTQACAPILPTVAGGQPEIDVQT